VFYTLDMTQSQLDDDLPGMALLTEPVRRKLYEYVVSQPSPVGRDEAAAAVGASRALAAFHLDRLEAGGLLDKEFARLSGRRGPGAGRPSKLYRRSGREFSLSLPPRDYELPARVFAQAISEASGLDTAVHRRARDVGKEIGEALRRQEAGRPGRKRLLSALRTLLEKRGFQPAATGSRELRLGNCPFDALTADFREVTCGMNHALLDGIVEGIHVPGLEAVADPKPGSCCVALRW
jgi:predicted ArsR family transcriptional regulator